MASTITFERGTHAAARALPQHSFQTATRTKARTRAGVLLWIVQGLLALLFLATGAMKLVLPIEALRAQIQLPGLFVRFLGLAEFSGAIGLVLPGLLRIRPGLTPLAAAGLVIIMIGATAFTLVGGGGATALMPLVMSILAASVSYGPRGWRLVRQGGSS